MISLACLHVRCTSIGCVWRHANGIESNRPPLTAHCTGILLSHGRYPRGEGEADEEWEARLKGVMANAASANLLKWIIRARNRPIK